MPEKRLPVKSLRNPKKHSKVNCWEIIYALFPSSTDLKWWFWQGRLGKCSTSDDGQKNHKLKDCLSANPLSFVRDTTQVCQDRFIASCFVFQQSWLELIDLKHRQLGVFNAGVCHTGNNNCSAAKMKHPPTVWLQCFISLTVTTTICKLSLTFWLLLLLLLFYLNMALIYVGGLTFLRGY